MPEKILCPECQSPYTYPMDHLMVCPECGCEWNPDEKEDVLIIKMQMAIYFKMGTTLL